MITVKTKGKPDIIRLKEEVRKYVRKASSDAWIEKNMSLEECLFGKGGDKNHVRSKTI